MIASIIEMVEETFLDCPIGTILSRSEIIDRVYNKFKVTRSSIIPSDYCYNITNEDKMKNKTLQSFNIFECISRGKYKYCGRNYAYSGKLMHKPKDQKYEVCVGEWINGKLTLI